MTEKEEARIELQRFVKRLNNDEYYCYLYNNTPQKQNVINTWIIDYLLLLCNDVGIDYYLTHQFTVRDIMSTYLDYAMEYKHKVSTLNTTLKKISKLHIEAIQRFENYKLQTLEK